MTPYAVPQKTMFGERAQMGESLRRVRRSWGKQRGSEAVLALFR